MKPQFETILVPAPASTMTKPPDESPSSVTTTVNLKSVDAMFATLLERYDTQKEQFVEFKKEVKSHLEKQDTVLTEIKSAGEKTLQQALRTNGRMDAAESEIRLLTLFRDSVKARVAGFVMAISIVGAVLGWVISNLVIPYVQTLLK